MNYIITGGSGFIGTHLSKLLKETHPECEVYNLDIQASDRWSSPKGCNLTGGGKKSRLTQHTFIAMSASQSSRYLSLQPRTT